MYYSLNIVVVYDAVKMRKKDRKNFVKIGGNYNEKIYS